ncbi:MAG: TMEM14 family protein [Verrucomicrobia bacterium]|nr:TMEM14 family protein [Verrucomicrobiota bacterium]
MAHNIVLWVYVGLLVVGGLMGFIKAGSKISLITSVAFAIPIAIAAAGALSTDVALGLIAFLAVFFGWRFAKTKSFRPAGLMVIVSALAFALVIVLP